MKKVFINETEFWDSKNECFINIEPQVLNLEHSLISISKWESKWHKPFLTDKPKTSEELIDYIKCMTINHNVHPLVYRSIPSNVLEEILEYIEDPMTATTVKEPPGKKGREIVTSELVYYWMIAFNIPMECEKWHFNRLITLIKVCEAKNNPKKKGRRESIEEYRALNKARRAKLKSKG